MSCTKNMGRQWRLIPAVWLRVPAVWLLGVVTAVGSPIVAADETSQVGSPHAAFTLPTIDDGRPISLQQFRGKKVLLIQFASW